MSSRLRKIRREDLWVVMRWRMLPEITQYMYSDPQLTIEKQIVWFEEFQKSNESRVWIIETLPDLEMVGLVSLANIDDIHRRCTWAYYIAESSSRGIGLAKTIECNICDFVFDVLGMNKLSCEVLSFNDRVVALHEKFGSKIDGTLRQHIYKNGEFHDVIQMSILRSEWMEKRRLINYSSIMIE